MCSRLKAATSSAPQAWAAKCTRTEQTELNLLSYFSRSFAGVKAAIPAHGHQCLAKPVLCVSYSCNLEEEPCFRHHCNADILKWHRTHGQSLLVNFYWTMLCLATPSSFWSKSSLRIFNVSNTITLSSSCQSCKLGKSHNIPVFYDNLEDIWSSMFIFPQKQARNLHSAESIFKDLLLLTSRV